MYLHFEGDLFPIFGVSDDRFLIKSEKCEEAKFGVSKDSKFRYSHNHLKYYHSW